MQKETFSKLKAGTLPVPRVQVIDYQGHKVHLYSIGWLAAFTGVAVVTLRLWERKSRLPRPIFNLKDGNRWYTGPEVKSFADLILRYMRDRDAKWLQSALANVSGTIRQGYRTMNEKTVRPPLYFALPEETPVQDLMQQRKRSRAQLERQAFCETLQKIANTPNENQAHGKKENPA